jgi:hypothetical protein
MKNGRPHDVQLSEPVRATCGDPAIEGCDFVFSTTGAPDFWI